MTLIANPIYDSVFKYMMEDDRVAKILLSALLQKDIIDLQMKPHEYTEMMQTRISMLRIDFAATVRNQDGSTQLILIELQKTWLATETLRFRQYLGTQYLDKKNVLPKDVNPNGYGIPIVSIYILGHKLGDLEEPVIYVRRNYLDYNSNPITDGVPDPFIESLTHDSVIVQIPYLKGRLRNRLEKILQVFDQEYCLKDDEHLMELDEESLGDDGRLIVGRLMKAAIAPEVRRAMEVEDEILSEIEARDTTIMLKDKMIEQKERLIERKDQEIELQNSLIKNMIQILSRQGLSAAEIAAQLNLTEEDIRRYWDGV
ncbi:hypothetical protein [Phocaeicola barnesiae]|uniref:hypothetical protein n=1 Tax=Phocaeicola barnesiae TaxID=376804 RepID=UPI000364B4FC|nr:hypothetical protein [Phocaeicola barnesiae]